MRKLSFRLTIRNVNSLDLLYSLHSSASFRLTIRNVNRQMILNESISYAGFRLTIRNVNSWVKSNIYEVIQVLD